MKTTKIIGTGSCVPDRIVTNDELAGVVDTSDSWIQERTGICRRHISVKETTSELAAEAARAAVLDAEILPEDLGLIIAATSSADTVMPTVACRVQAALGNRSAVCFDLNAACSGFLYSLNVAHSMIKSGLCSTALVVGAENMSKTIDWTDRGTCVLFGDGAGACVLQASDDGWISTVSGADGLRGDVLTYAGNTLHNFLTAPLSGETPYMKMDGQAVFKFAVKTVPACINSLLEQAGCRKQDVRWYLLHQANERIISAAARRLGEPIEKFPINLNEYGNTSAASIPILLDEMNREGRLEQGDKIVLAGFGAGLTWGATLLTWQDDHRKMNGTKKGK